MNEFPGGTSRASRFARRTAAVAFAAGLLLGLATSGGIAGERLTRGAFSVAILANAAATFAALVALVPTMRRLLVSFAEISNTAARKVRIARLGPLAVLAPQLVGATCGIVLVHAVLRHVALPAFPWLSEQPAQLVNDAVAACGLLALVWAAAEELNPKLLVLAFLGVTLYRASAPAWHLDDAPGGFHTSIQELVVAQFVAAAFALAIFRFTLDARVR